MPGPLVCPGFPCRLCCAVLVVVASVLVGSPARPGPRVWPVGVGLSFSGLMVPVGLCPGLVSRPKTKEQARDNVLSFDFVEISRGTQSDIHHTRAGRVARGEELPARRGGSDVSRCLKSTPRKTNFYEERSLTEPRSLFAGRSRQMRPVQYRALITRQIQYEGAEYTPTYRVCLYLIVRQNLQMQERTVGGSLALSEYSVRRGRNLSYAPAGLNGSFLTRTTRGLQINTPAE